MRSTVKQLATTDESNLLTTIVVRFETLLILLCSTEGQRDPPRWVKENLLLFLLSQILRVNPIRL